MSSKSSRPSAKSSRRIAATILRDAQAAKTPREVESVHMGYAAAKAELAPGDAFRCLCAVEEAQRRVRA